jgi:hypothetical protein
VALSGCFADGTAVDMGSIAINTAMPTANTLEITFDPSPLPGSNVADPSYQPAKYRIDLSGITATCDGEPVPADHRFLIALVGDTDGNRDVDNFDLATIRFIRDTLIAEGRVIDPTTPGIGAFEVRSDVDMNGLVDNFDLATVRFVRDNRAHDSAGIPCP